jgi:hypothetical protein
MMTAWLAAPSPCAIAASAASCVGPHGASNVDLAGPVPLVPASDDGHMIMTGNIVPGPLVAMQNCLPRRTRPPAPGVSLLEAKLYRGATDTEIWTLPEAVAPGRGSGLADAGAGRPEARQAAASMAQRPSRLFRRRATKSKYILITPTLCPAGQMVPCDHIRNG